MPHDPAVLPFRLAPRKPGEPEPAWTGSGFRVGEESVAILEYSANLEGWSDDLTAMHEDAAGADHPIDLASRRGALHSLAEHLRVSPEIILEVGSSSGFLLPLLRQRYGQSTIVGSDVVRGPLLKLAVTHPDIPILRFDLTCCPLPDACVDAVVMLNVLEHIEDDVEALRQVRRILKPGGIVVIEVPAGPKLYDFFDKHLHHFRRYSAASLREVGERAGLRQLASSHVGFFVFPAFWAVKKKNRLFPPAGERVEQARVEGQIASTGSSALLSSLMECETWCGERAGISFPFGIRCTGVFARQ